MLNMDNIFLKYANSSEKWILPVPVVENGQLKLRCYMTNRKELTGFFNVCYTYAVNFETLTDFFSFKSHGQAYNEIIKFKKVRTGFLKESDKEIGTFTLKDIRDTVANGKTAIVLEALQHKLNLENRRFTIEPITKEEKQARKEEKEEIARLEKELMEMGYNY